MDEVELIQAKTLALLNARNYLLHQQPTDMVAVGNVTEAIVDLASEQMARSSQPNIPQIPPAREAALKNAVDALQQAAAQSAAAEEIVKGVTALMQV